MPESADERAKALLDKAEAEHKRDTADEQFVLARGQLRDLEQRDCYVITSAQNNTGIHQNCYATLRHYADYFNGAFEVVPLRYKNPTGYDPDLAGKRDRWPEFLHEFMVENEVRLADKLKLMGQWKLQATTQRPLTGLEPITGTSSAIFGHGRLQMKCVPTLADFPKLLYTTGSISEQNYSDTGLGQKGRFHHTHGAVAVHKVGGRFHIRHLNWSDQYQCIIDLNKKFTPHGVEDAERAVAVIFGDTHQIWEDPAIRRGHDEVVELLRPHYIVSHDDLDFYAGSHHHDKDPILKHVKAREGYASVEKELRLTLDRIVETTPAWAERIVVASNHNEHLMRWLREKDPKTDPANAPLYHKLMGLMLERSEMRRGGVWQPDAFKLWAEELAGGVPERVRFLERMESFQRLMVEMGLHGDEGSNGRRGNAADFARLAVKTVTAHTHTCGILDGNYGVGVGSEPWREYHRGPSSVLPTLCALYENGKRQLIHLIEGAFR